MNKTVGTIVVLVLCAALAAPALAQTATDLELTRAEILKERQAIIAATLELSEDQALAFWPAYRDYRVDMARVEDRFVRLLSEFVEAEARLTDEQAIRLLDEFLDITATEASVRKKHARRMRKLLPPTKVTRFFQIENKLDAVIDYELAAAIPLTR